jgi:hypothetical protein
MPEVDEALIESPLEDGLNTLEVLEHIAGRVGVGWWFAH